MYKASPLHAGLKMVDENDKGGGGFSKNGHPPKTKILNTRELPGVALVNISKM